MLLLDEFPLLRTDVIDALRQPLESGEVTIARGDDTVTYPARGMVVLAANPCPCGEFTADVQANRCTCKERQRRDYRDRVRGPISDRIDITRHLRPLMPHDAADPTRPPESSADVRVRVSAARDRQALRYRERAWGLNGQVPGPVLVKEWPLGAAQQRVVDDLMYKGGLSRRGATRVHRIAWTVADLRAADEPSVDDVETALRLRTGEPLLASSLRRVAS